MFRNQRMFGNFWLLLCPSVPILRDGTAEMIISLQVSTDFLNKHPLKQQHSYLVLGQ